MIQGYPDRLSVAPGETLTLHLATDHPELRVAIYRQGVDQPPRHLVVARFLRFGFDGV